MRPINLIKGAKQMKAVVMHEYGGPDVLKYEDVPDPVPGKGEVLIRMAAASINPVDLWQRAGTTKASLRVEFPAIIGWDLSGTVVGLGPEVRELAVGDHVFAARCRHPGQPPPTQARGRCQPSFRLTSTRAHVGIYNSP